MTEPQNLEPGHDPFVQGIRDLTMEAVKFQKLDEHRVGVILRGIDGTTTEEIVDLRDWNLYNERPPFIQTHQRFGDVESFTDFVHRYATDGLTLTQSGSSQIDAICDDSLNAEVLGWSRIRASYQPRLHRVTQRLFDADRKQRSQEELIDWLEDLQPWIIEPNSAELLEMMSLFHGTIGTQWKSAINLTNGARQLEWKETIDTNVVREGGSQEVPGTIAFSVPLFTHDDVVTRVEARVRYRVRGGSLSVALLFDDINDLIESRMNDDIEHIEQYGWTVWKASF